MVFMKLEGLKPKHKTTCKVRYNIMDKKFVIFKVIIWVTWILTKKDTLILERQINTTKN